MDHAADRLQRAILERATPTCVGLDPVLERLPRSLRSHPATESGAALALRDFSLHVLDQVAPHVPVVKLQAACFERYRHRGMEMCFELIAEAHGRGLEVILDAKRGDIGISAEHYASGCFEGAPGNARPDWLTINGYLGEDGIRPFLCAGHGAFVLVRTSNPGGDGIQSVRTREGATVAEVVADEVARIGQDTIGASGLSSLGAVVGATKRDEARSLRERMGAQMFLVPGFGAQGGGVDDVMDCFLPGGRGAVVTASRSVIYAEPRSGEQWQVAISRAAEEFAQQLGAATGLR